jgi:methionyl-tRNA formyltransferase
MRVAALGRTRMLMDAIRGLVAAGHEVPLIATCKATPEHEVREEDFRALAAELGSEFLQTQDLNNSDALSRLKQARADLAVSVSWISLVGSEACKAFPHGILNVHGGELPRYRGNAPIAWAILQGEQRVGLTIHLMVPEEVDAGPIVMVDYFPLSEQTYIGEVYQFLERRAPELLLASVEGLAKGTIVPRPQAADPAQALRCYPRRPEDGRIDWPLPGRAIGRLVRASAEPFGGAYTTFNEQRLVVWRARPEPWTCPSLAVPGQIVGRDIRSGEVRVATGDGVLVLEQVQLGASRQAPASVIKSLRDRLGSVPQA